LDDLRHIQFLLSGRKRLLKVLESLGSPRKDQFRKKIEFLVQLSQKTLKNVKASPNEVKETVSKKLEFGSQIDPQKMYNFSFFSFVPLYCKKDLEFSY